MLNSPALPLLKYQKDSFNDRSRFKALMWARGARKTSTVTLEIVDDCFLTEAMKRRTTWIILSRGERQALEAIQEAVRHCKAYRMAQTAIDYGEYVHIDPKTGEHRVYTKFQINFPLGSKIIALPANADTARGFSGNVFLDEFSIHEDDVEIWRSMQFVLRGRYRIIVSSTPKGGTSRKFYQIINDTSGDWSRHIVDIYKAVADGLPFDIELERRVMADPDGWSQEMELQWITESGPWIDYDSIVACEDSAAGLGEVRSRGEYYFGNDIARRKHLWVLWVFERVGDVLWTREVVTLEGATFAEHDAAIDRAYKKYRPLRMSFDQTGIGERSVEGYIEKYPGVAEGVLFSGSSKAGMAMLGKRSFQDRTIRIPRDEKYRNDFHRLQRIETPAGNIRYDAEADDTGHCDYTWACFLALNAASTGSPPSLNARTSGVRRLKTLAGF